MKNEKKDILKRDWINQIKYDLIYLDENTLKNTPKNICRYKMQYLLTKAASK